MLASAATLGMFFGAVLVGGASKGQYLSWISTGSAVAIAGALITIMSWTAKIGSRTHLGLLFGQLIFGVGIGITVVIVPSFVTYVIPQKLKAMIGATYQVFITVGICFGALCGLVLQSLPWIVIEVLFATSILASLCLLLVSKLQAPTIVQLLTKGTTSPSSSSELRSQSNDNSSEDGVVRRRESKSNSNSSSSSSSTNTSAVAVEGLDALPTPKRSFLFYRRAIVTGLALSAAQQLTGINAIMAFAPNMMAAAGAQPLMGNFLLMTWNMVTTVVSMPLTKLFSSPKSQFTWCLLGASLSCIGVGAALAFGPSADVASSAAQQHASSGAEGKMIGVAAGIGCFVMFFEFGMGPMFFVLVPEVFPPTHRDTGGAFIQATQFIFNLLVNFFYPVLVELLAARSGDTIDKEVGMERVFFIFGVIGLWCFVWLKILLPAGGGTVRS